MLQTARILAKTIACSGRDSPSFLWLHGGIVRLLSNQSADSIVRSTLDLRPLVRGRGMEKKRDVRHEDTLLPGPGRMTYTYALSPRFPMPDPRYPASFGARVLFSSLSSLQSSLFCLRIVWARIPNTLIRSAYLRRQPASTAWLSSRCYCSTRLKPVPSMSHLATRASVHACPHLSTRID